MTATTPAKRDSALPSKICAAEVISYDPDTDACLRGARLAAAQVRACYVCCMVCFYRLWHWRWLFADFDGSL